MSAIERGAPQRRYWTDTHQILGKVTRVRPARRAERRRVSQNGRRTGRSARARFGERPTEADLGREGHSGSASATEGEGQATGEAGDAGCGQSGRLSARWLAGDRPLDGVGLGVDDWRRKSASARARLQLDGRRARMSGERAVSAMGRGKDSGYIMRSEYVTAGGSRHYVSGGAGVRGRRDLAAAPTCAAGGPGR